MAGSLKTRDNSDELDEAHEINVTPFIDVMLVLLIIFMVAAPLSTVDVAVDLPASNAQPQPRPNEPVFVSIKEDLTLAIGNDAVGRDALRGALEGKTQGNADERIFVRADKTVDYGELMAVMNLIREAGYLKIGLVGLERIPGAPAAGIAVSSPGSPEITAPAEGPASAATPSSQGGP